MSGRPNLLWLFCDQLRYHALACNGDRNVATPNLDRLAGEGVRCTHAVSHYPVCMPHHGIGRDGRDGQPAPPEYEARFTPAAVELRGNVPAHVERKARAKLAGYYAMIANLDHNVGRVLDWLEESGLAESTLVAFFSDHGELGGSHGHFGKYRPYDESIRIPLLLRLPGTLPAGLVHEEVVSGIDLFATCAGLCGVPLFAGQQGVDHTPALRGDTGPVRDAALVQWLGPSRTAWDDGYPYRAIRTRRHTYCVGPDEPFRLLFDNEEDELQHNNLFGQRSAVALQAALHRRLCNAVTQSGEPLPDVLIDREERT